MAHGKSLDITHSSTSGTTRAGARLRLVAAVATVATLLSATTGCSRLVYGTTGKVMAGYAIDHMMPSMMASGDLAMACETGVSLGSFLQSFERVAGDVTDRPALMTMMAAGMCAEAEGWEAELAQIRAQQEGRIAALQDARIREKQARSQAAARYYAAYQKVMAVFGDVAQVCPHFDSPGGSDAVLMMLGLSSGVLAVMHDRAAGGAVGVPLAAMREMERGARCLDNDVWWGMPNALRAAVWSGVPGSAPDGVDPWQMLEQAATEAGQTGVRLAQAFVVQVAAAQGRAGALRRWISTHGKDVKAVRSHPNWRMLDGYATQLVLHESDKLWTEATGHRTPFGGLGTFWDDGDDALDDMDDDIFDGLDPEGRAVSSGNASGAS